ncbi:dihydroneopterin aldolase [Microlunatus antarcticus]|uniref:7,8-dihydroneopterin aldolase n=1 Tax=Microlunatus antarcticus TaxID=53388 RepID=A0A7W5P5C7_9ACTN|nr:dihydroneopterin aldolase [Microlunatus antarcticus]MBB3325340.1 dihydroneopterin aldolase [Microlunatus antarcticus]
MTSAAREVARAAAPVVVRDRVVLTGLRARGRHGVFDHEREQGQHFVVDVALALDLSPASTSDDLSRTVDYGTLAEAVVADVQGEPLNLIEALAERIAQTCLRQAAVTEVEVTVHKPEAPIGVAFTDVAVTLTRSRP